MEMAVPPTTDTVTQTDVPPPRPLTWLGSPGGTARRVLLSTSPKRNSETLQGRGRGGGVIPEVHEPYSPTPLCPHRPLELTCS